MIPHAIDRPITALVRKTGNLMCRFRGNALVDAFYHWVVAFERSLDNENFTLESNGELRVLDAIAATQPTCVIDVGANEGEWLQLAAKRCPASRIHAFEIVPATFERLQKKVAGSDRITLYPFGLSDQAGEVTVHTSERSSSTATACPIAGMKFHEEYYTSTLQRPVKTAAEFIRGQGIERIDLLKIDVEGMDFQVIRGLEEEIDKVRVIQFEYGIFNIASHAMLADISAYLTERGFRVGRIFPRFVDFFEYDFWRENFHGGNYLAVRQDDEDLIQRLT